MAEGFSFGAGRFGRLDLYFLAHHYDVITARVHSFDRYIDGFVVHTACLEEADYRFTTCDSICGRIDDKVLGKHGCGRLCAEQMRNHGRATW